MTVLAGTNIEHGAVIAAGSVVTKIAPPFAILAGAPARVIGYRFAESVREQLLATQWWYWDEDRIRRNKAFFDTSISRTEAFDLGSVVMD